MTTAEEVLNELIAGEDAKESRDGGEEQESKETAEATRRRLLKDKLALLRKKRTNSDKKLVVAEMRVNKDPAAPKPLSEKEAKKKIRAEQRANVQDAWSKMGLAPTNFEAERASVLKALALNDKTKAQRILASVASAARDKTIAQQMFVPPPSMPVELPARSTH